MKKLIVILGPTASGKSDLAVTLARRFSGEIISADSRQIYKGLDIGSGKIIKSQMKGIPHYLLDVASPQRRFTVAQFQKLALQKIKEIQSHDQVPFLVGGTGLYIQSIVDGVVFPNVKPSRALRARLAKKSVQELFNMLKKLDPVRATNIDPRNPQRLIRALEIVLTTKKPVPTLYYNSRTYENNSILQLGISTSKSKLKKAIQKRLLARLPKIIIEVKKLHKKGLSFKRLEELGLEYRFVAQYLQKKLNKPEMINILQKEIWQYSKRQMTWFNRDKRIHWIRNKSEAEKLIKKFI